MSMFSRRSFLASAHAVGLFYSGAATGAFSQATTSEGSRLLKADPEGVLDLPEGFSYRLLSTSGAPMDDGFIRPGSPDGMACFPHLSDRRKCILMRNHENFPDMVAGPFGADGALASRANPQFIYDRRTDGRPFAGAVTKIVYDLSERRVDREFLVLAGTTANCSGGPTPWRTWLTCEESIVSEGSGAMRPHGFVFETPADTTSLIRPQPLRALGRFVHEGAAIDPRTSIAYLTEDSPTGLLYRFIPDRPARLNAGRLQALALRDWRSANTSNWPVDWGGPGLDRIRVGQTFETEWIDLKEVEAPEGDLARRGHAAGAAQFYRGEGIAYGNLRGSTGAVYFNCTEGGSQRVGQVWRYRPGAREAQDDEAKEPGMLTLLYESPGADTLDMCDNLTITPWGDLILCEDGSGEQYLRGVTAGGAVYDIARNAHSGNSEFCGACFSPDGRLLFVNIQEPGFTIAIEGPWGRLRPS